MAKISITIDWSELDLYGHVNNVAYYKYMQAARICYCDSIGLTAINETGKLSFILAASNCHYKQKLFYPGTIEILSSVSQIGNSSFHLDHCIYNHKGELVAQGKDVLVIYDYEKNHKVQIDEILKNTLNQSLSRQYK